MYRHWLDSFNHLPTTSISGDSAAINTVPRAILCVDADCFESQVWIKKIYPDYLGQDIPVVIVNPDYVILSVSYPARAPPYGVTRTMSKQELADLEDQYPELKVLCTGTRYGRCDTFIPYQEGDKIMNAAMSQVMKYRGILVEKASPDEFFLDITAPLLLKRWNWNFYAKKSFPCKEHHGKPKSVLYGDSVMNYSGQHIRDRLEKIENSSSEEAFMIKAGIFSEILLDEIYEKTGYHCSAGVGPNKLIAKVASDMNKPSGVAMMTTKAFIRETFSLPYSKLPGLKRNTGAGMESFYEEKVNSPLMNIHQLGNLSFDELCEFYGNKGEQDPSTKANTLYDNVRGIDGDPVKHKLHENNMSFSYTFRGSNRAQVQDVRNLAQDMKERVDYLVEYQFRVPEHYLLGIKMKNVRAEIKRRMDVNDEKPELSLDPHDLEDFVWTTLNNNNIHLDAVEVLQFRAMNIKFLE